MRPTHFARLLLLEFLTVKGVVNLILIFIFAAILNVLSSVRHGLLLTDGARVQAAAQLLHVHLGNDA